jgi:hypothetical protein
MPILLNGSYYKDSDADVNNFRVRCGIETCSNPQANPKRPMYGPNNLNGRVLKKNNIVMRSGAYTSSASRKLSRQTGAQTLDIGNFQAAQKGKTPEVGFYIDPPTFETPRTDQDDLNQIDPLTGNPKGACAQKNRNLFPNGTTVRHSGPHTSVLNLSNRVIPKENTVTPNENRTYQLKKNGDRSPATCTVLAQNPKPPLRDPTKPPLSTAKKNPKPGPESTNSKR